MLHLYLVAIISAPSWVAHPPQPARILRIRQTKCEIMYISEAKHHAAYKLKLEILEGLGRPVAPGATILDFGCGIGQAVRFLRDRGFEAYGFDVQVKWEPDSDASDLIEAGIIRVNTEEAAPLPFPDGMFDVVLSYQVFEHVHDYEHSVAELARVMKPGGVSVHVFPSRYRPFEAHIGVPFSSVLPHYWWLSLWASLGYSKPHQRQFPPAEIARRNHKFLKSKTHYIPGREIRRHFEANYHEVEFAEKEFLCLSGRIGHLSKIVRALPILPALFGTFWTRVVMAASPVALPGDAANEAPGKGSNQ